MPEYITKDTLKETLIDWSCDASYIEVETKWALEEIKKIPAADVVPVRHGRWEKADEQPYFRKHFHTVVCFVCHRAGRQVWNYCPNCGAKMNLEDK